MVDKEFIENFAEINAGMNFMYQGKYKVRLVGYNEETGLLIVSGHPDGWSVFNRRDGDVLLVWNGVVSGRLYYVKPSDLVPYVEKNKEFAEKHAGEYFLYDKVKVKVQVVGYRAGRTQILVSVPEHIGTFGWDSHLLEPEDVFVIFPNNGVKFWYVEIEQLK